MLSGDSPWIDGSYVHMSPHTHTGKKKNKIKSKHSRAWLSVIIYGVQEAEDREDP